MSLVLDDPTTVAAEAEALIKEAVSAKCGGVGPLL